MDCIDHGVLKVMQAAQAALGVVSPEVEAMRTPELPGAQPARLWIPDFSRMSITLEIAWNIWAVRSGVVCWLNGTDNASLAAYNEFLNLGPEDLYIQDCFEQAEKLSDIEAEKKKFLMEETKAINAYLRTAPSLDHRDAALKAYKERVCHYFGYLNIKGLKLRQRVEKHSQGRPVLNHCRSFSFFC